MCKINKLYNLMRKSTRDQKERREKRKKQWHYKTPSSFTIYRCVLAFSFHFHCHSPSRLLDNLKTWISIINYNFHFSCLSYQTGAEWPRSPDTRNWKKNQQREAIKNIDSCAWNWTWASGFCSATTNKKVLHYRGTTSRFNFN